MGLHLPGLGQDQVGIAILNIPGEKVDVSMSSLINQTRSDWCWYHW